MGRRGISISILYWWNYKPVLTKSYTNIYEIVYQYWRNHILVLIKSYTKKTSWPFPNTGIQFCQYQYTVLPIMTNNFCQYQYTILSIAVYDFVYMKYYDPSCPLKYIHLSLWSDFVNIGTSILGSLGAWRPKHRFFFSSKCLQEQPEAKLWHKNDVFDEK